MNPTEQQQAVIDSHEGVVIVKACPGSGKTSTLVKRVKALPADETKIVLAFNKKAADEFSHRLGSASHTKVRTFHSFCMRAILENPKGFGFKTTPRLYQDVPFFRQLCIANEAPREWQRWEDAQGTWDEDLVNYAQHAMYSDDLVQRIRHLKATPQPDKIEENTLIAVWKYRKWLRDCCLMTFDTMVIQVAEHCDSLKIAAQHVMVDEYQDVDRFQFDIACALARIPNVKSLAVVGDPNQRIYAWRGALENAFEDIEDRFPQAKVLPMTMNFRSVDSIIRYADAICPTGMSGVRGDVPNSVVTPGEGDNAVQILIKDLSVDYSSAAILCRFNRECAMWKLRLAREGIPVFVIGGADFWNLKHIKIAEKFWKEKRNIDFILETEEWKKFADQRRFKNDPDALKDCIDDVKWILGLTSADMRILKENLQNEREGLRVSTMHKTKGMEWDRVMVYGIDEELKRDVYLYYVACSRAKNLMVLN
ncbi:putative helicase [Bdellovibrio phage phi1422]|uniref:DNA helicase n=1 Tax=Bdellovibrio phage phi1422 TaxID=1127515 RepID=UPI0002536D48|nr:DNA helicase [Bdellovibrio phage phi1422]AFC22540.1 putative helicase [Bdellovibrio phage phi1422]